jgi:hypothetical protein
MGIALLARLDCVERMHEHVARGTTNSASQHCLRIVNLCRSRRMR